MRALVSLFLVSCTAEVACDIEPVDIELPAHCYADEAACPQDVPGEPWEAACGRAYLCEVEQVDGSTPFVCVRARDCGCLEDWADCTGDDVPMPGHCEAKL